MVPGSRHIQDSRGVMRPVFPAAASWVADPAGPPPRPRGEYTKTIVLVISIMGALISLAGAAFGQPIILGVGVPCVIALWIVAVWLTRDSSRAAPAYESFSTLLSSGFCPSCAYRIDNIRPDLDGCTICPECGAAWRR